MVGSELETDFGEMGGVGGAEVIGEVILAEACGDDAILFEPPIVVAATGFPVGDVAFGDLDAVFIESADNLGVRDVVPEHAVDHVAFGVREAGDFAVAGARPGFGGRKDLKLRASGGDLRFRVRGFEFRVKLGVHDS